MEDTEENRKRVFFSYSRADSEFALKLARAVRDGGVPIWFDKLDIPPGANWDREIEEALKITQTMLVLLSPDAVKSENVLDEVGFAIDDHDRVVPVMYRDCDMPLRLRRRQWVDMRHDFDAGLDELLALLGGGHQRSLTSLHRAIDPEEVMGRSGPPPAVDRPENRLGETHASSLAPQASSDPRPSREPQPLSNKTKLLLAAGGVLISGLVAAKIFAPADQASVYQPAFASHQSVEPLNTEEPVRATAATPTSEVEVAAPSTNSAASNADAPAPPVENAEKGKLLVGTHWCDVDGPLHDDGRFFQCYVDEEAGSLAVKDGGPAGKLLGTVTGSPGTYELKWSSKRVRLQGRAEASTSKGAEWLVAESGKSHVKIRLDVINAK